MKEDYYNEERPLFHPYKLYLFLLLAGITALFLATTGAYIYTRVQTNTPPINVPFIFIFNTFILIGSSLTLRWANEAYKKDNTTNYKRALGATVGLTLLFMAMQAVGWSMLKAQGALLTSGPCAAYIYAASILHIIHIVGGLPFLIWFFIVAIKRMREPVSVLVYFSDPAKRLKLELLSSYWHFLDYLWIYLVSFFLISSFIVF